MIEIVIIILIGKQFYQLAKKYEQKVAWAYFIVGIVSYYGGAFVGGLILGLYIDITGSDFFYDMNELVLSLIFIPIAIFSCWGTYQLLKKKWHKEYLEKERNKPKISDIGKSEDELDHFNGSF
jgi:branched-subunit amino acid ABC-type transport system permease component